jgi:lipoate---protein ligase
MRCEKIKGGKLVCIDAALENGKVNSVSITGDFFLHPEDRVSTLERTLIGVPASISQRETEVLIKGALGDAVLIGASCEDLARLFVKEIS